MPSIRGSMQGVCQHVFITRIFFLLLCMFELVTGTPLDDYVLQPDPLFSWYDTGLVVKGWFPTGKWEAAVLNMTSQGWLSSSDVDCSVWTHHLVVVKPGTIKYKSTAFLLVGGGSNTDDPPTAKDELLALAAALAVDTKSVAAVLYQVPNQPCRFASDESRRHRYEDDLIAYTWFHFLKHADDVEWPARLPMTKAAVRAMDAIQQYASPQLSVQVESFVVAGASKRGWTTWTTGAVDKRVVGIVPIVMDALNFVPNLHHFFQSLGGWTFAFEPYYALHITTLLDTPEMAKLMNIVDPYAYKERLTMPKLIVVAANDEFFMMDDSQYYWNDLKGEKHMLILSNTEHSLATGLVKLLAAVQAFYLSILVGSIGDYEGLEAVTDVDFSIVVGRKVANSFVDQRNNRPKYWWNIDRQAGSIQVIASEKPIKATIWYAYTKDSKRRDFRWLTGNINDCPTFVILGGCFQPIFFKEKSISASLVDGIWSHNASIAIPEEGYGAFFVELWFSGPALLLPFIFTTEAVIVPDGFPYSDCFGAECMGTLI